MSRMEVDKAHLRPFLSPMFPQKIAPSGRTRNASANTPNVIMVATILSSPGKNTRAKTVARYE